MTAMGLSINRSLPATGRPYLTCEQQAQTRARYSTVKTTTEKTSNQRRAVSKRASIDLTVPRITAMTLSRMSMRMKMSKASKTLPRESSGLSTSKISQILFFKFIASGEWPYFFSQRLESRIASQCVQHRLDIDERHETGPFRVSLLKPLEGPIQIAQSQINHRDEI